MSHVFLRMYVHVDNAKASQVSNRPGITACTGCPSDIVPPGIRIFDMKGLSKNMNSTHLA